MKHRHMLAEDRGLTRLKKRDRCGDLGIAILLALQSIHRYFCLAGVKTCKVVCLIACPLCKHHAPWNSALTRR